VPAKPEKVRRVTAPATLLVGAGRMGVALLQGWTRQGDGPLIAVEPNPSAQLRKFAKANRIALLNSIDAIPQEKIRTCVVALKPQVLKTEAIRLKPVADSGALMLSIAAGTSLRELTKAWGIEARIVRAMPNIPGSIGHGISALFAPGNVTARERKTAQHLLAALGETIWVEREGLIDVVTAVSGSGPAYVFLLVEALADAAEAQGFDRGTADRLARATITGAGALLDAEPRPAAELRRDVTSPGGTTAAALSILQRRDGMTRLIADAVAAAVRRAKELGA
jgi:pyrroline-5-carboxylate reductase